MMFFNCAVTDWGCLLWMEFQLLAKIWASLSSRLDGPSLLYGMVLYYCAMTGLRTWFSRYCSFLVYGVWFAFEDWRPTELVCEPAPNYPVLWPELQEPFCIPVSVFKF